MKLYDIVDEDMALWKMLLEALKGDDRIGMETFLEGMSSDHTKRESYKGCDKKVFFDAVQTTTAYLTALI